MACFPSLFSTHAWLPRKATSGNHPSPVLLTWAFVRSLSIPWSIEPKVLPARREGDSSSSDHAPDDRPVAVLFRSVKWRDLRSRAHVHFE